MSLLPEGFFLLDFWFVLFFSFFLRGNKEISKKLKTSGLSEEECVACIYFSAFGTCSSDILFR